VGQILLLAPCYLGVGGAERYTRLFARALATVLGPRSVAVWSYLGGPIPAESEPSYLGAAASRSGMWGKTRFVARAARLARRVTLIVAGHVSVAPLASRLGRLYGVPYVVMTYGIEVWGSLPPGRRAALRKARRVVAISRYTASRLQQDHSVAEDQITVIPPVVDPAFLSRAAAAAARPAGPPRQVLTVARLSAREGYKGCDAVLEALARLRGTVGPVRYVIVGDGDDRPRLQALAAELGVGALVHFAGGVPDRDLAGYYEGSHLFAMPSRSGYAAGRWRGEGFGIVFIEAGAFGLPAIAGLGDGGQEAVEHEVTGFIVDGGDIEAVAGAMRRLLSDDALRLRMGQAARARVLREFTLPRMERQVGDLLGELGQRRESEADEWRREAGDHT